MDAQTTVTVRCTACGKLGEVKPSCGCGAAFEYISPGELASKAVSDNPGMSNREIGRKLGIDEGTVRNARKRSGAEDSAPRKGKDGKTYPGKRKSKAPGVKQAQRSIDLTPETWEEVKLRATQANMSAAELIGRLLTSTVEIDPKTLPKTAQEKLAVALRQQQRMENTQFEQRVSAEVTKRNQKAFPLLEKYEREARDEKRLYERLRREMKKLGTIREWNNLVFCLHPDTRGDRKDDEPTLIKRRDTALQWILSRKFAITGEE